MDNMKMPVIKYIILFCIVYFIRIWYYFLPDIEKYNKKHKKYGYKYIIKKPKYYPVHINNLKPILCTRYFQNCLKSEVKGFHVLSVYELDNSIKRKREKFDYMVEHTQLKNPVNNISELEDNIYSGFHSEVTYHKYSFIKKMLGSNNQKSLFDYFCEV